jgi:hypothetical protein
MTWFVWAVPMEETDTVSIAQEIIYRNYTIIVSSSNNCFLFLSPNLTNEKRALILWKLMVSSQWQIQGFLCIGSRVDMVSP